jgi:hypothetical protein
MRPHHRLGPLDVAIAHRLQDVSVFLGRRLEVTAVRHRPQAGGLGLVAQHAHEGEEPRVAAERHQPEMELAIRDEQTGDITDGRGGLDGRDLLLSTPTGGTHELFNTTREHGELLDLIEAGEAKETAALMRRHLQHARGVWAGLREGSEAAHGAGT